MKNTARIRVRHGLLAAILLGLALCAQAAPPPGGIAPPASVLFVGNSFTFYNNAVYTHLRKFLVAGDPSTRQSIFLKSMTISGAVLADHRGGLEQLLDSRPWDVVVLQGHSREAIDASLAPGFEATAREFAQSIRSKGARPVLFMTWAYADQPGMTAPLAAAFGRLGKVIDAPVVPVGLAFERALADIPGVALYDPDRVHPSLAGTYLAGAVFYAALYGKSPAGLAYDAGLDEGLARQLREVAWETTRDYFGMN